MKKIMAVIGIVAVIIGFIAGVIGATGIFLDCFELKPAKEYKDDPTILKISSYGRKYTEVVPTMERKHYGF